MAVCVAALPASPGWLIKGRLAALTPAPQQQDGLRAGHSSGIGCVTARGRRWRSHRAEAVRGGSLSEEAQLQAFEVLAEAAGVKLPGVKLGRTPEGENGLFATTAFKEGDVLVSVPKAVMILADNRGSFTNMDLPEGSWSWLVQGINADGPGLTWDVLQALALVDAGADSACTWWQDYAEALLPAPLELSLPMCLPGDLLEELQHAEVADAAGQQQARLAQLAPTLAGPMVPGGPSWLQWALSCVRSRSFRLADELYAMVPFLDLANHAEQPNADFRVPEGFGSGGAADMVELVAVKAIDPAKQICISYTGPQGYTNRRMMAQYGFVPEANPADRIMLQCTASTSARLSLERVQTALGDNLFAAIASGRQNHLFAALKSMPLSDSPGASDSTASAEELALCRSASAEAASTLASMPTSLKEDESLLQDLRASTDPASSRRQRVMEYRVERKKLLAATEELMAILGRD